MRQALIETARAKVNLTLRVLGRRADGYHELESLVAFADVGDGIEFLPGAPPAVAVRGPFARAIFGTNIAALALHAAAAAAAGIELGAVAIEKRLPVAAGLGGGSADAAAVLRAVRRANPARAAAVDWHAVAASLGADVPVCLHSAAQFMWGTGHDTVVVPPLPLLPAILVNPGVPLATADVFRALAAPPVSVAAVVPVVTVAPVPPGPFHDVAAVIAYMRNHANDLEPAAVALCPAIGTVLAALRDLPAARVARMSGSGPTCFALFDSAADAAVAARRIKDREPRWWVEVTTLG
jgi:4-diphosphocytidyl-2-C-methyl-D-erythritol kinase